MASKTYVLRPVWRLPLFTGMPKRIVLRSSHTRDPARLRQAAASTKPCVSQNAPHAPALR
jgi:hypothetical protein